MGEVSLLRSKGESLIAERSPLIYENGRFTILIAVLPCHYWEQSHQAISRKRGKSSLRQKESSMVWIRNGTVYGFGGRATNAILGKTPVVGIIPAVIGCVGATEVTKYNIIYCSRH